MNLVVVHSVLVLPLGTWCYVGVPICGSAPHPIDLPNPTYAIKYRRIEVNACDSTGIYARLKEKMQLQILVSMEW